jgi:uncharacterized BrkB/YihY/UPF0761 family membrane protein
MKKKNRLLKKNNLSIGILLLIVIGSLQIISHFVRVKYPISSQIISYINFITIPLFLFFIYLYIKGAADPKSFLFTFGILLIFIFGLLLISSHYIQNLYYTDRVAYLKIFDHAFPGHLIVDIVIFSVIGIFILLFISFTQSRRE